MGLDFRGMLHFSGQQHLIACMGQETPLDVGLELIKPTAIRSRFVILSVKVSSKMSALTFLRLFMGSILSLDAALGKSFYQGPVKVP